MLYVRRLSLPFTLSKAFIVPSLQNGIYLQDNRLRSPKHRNDAH